MTDETTAIDRTADELSAVLAELAGVVDAVTEDQLDKPTACESYDVAALRAHILSWLTTFAAGFADDQGRAPNADDFDLSDDPGGQVRAAAAQLDAAVRGGAAGRPLWLGEASMPGEMALSMILWEYVVHGWDLARATGRPWEPPEAAASAALAFAPGMLTPDYQGEGKAFGPSVQVPADAAPLDRLVGLSGRDPGWSRP